MILSQLKIYAFIENKEISKWPQTFQRKKEYILAYTIYTFLVSTNQ